MTFKDIMMKKIQEKIEENKITIENENGEIKIDNEFINARLAKMKEIIEKVKEEARKAQEEKEDFYEF